MLFRSGAVIAGTTRWPKASLPASSSNSFIKFNAQPAPRRAPRFSNISNYSITAHADIRPSAIAVPPNLNDVTINGGPLNPGVHQLGASSQSG